MTQRRIKIRALAVVVAALVAAMGSQAWAATCTASRTATSTCTTWRTTSSGVKYCALWCTGSEVCDNTIMGLGGNISKQCTQGVNCPVTSCASYGTVPINTGDQCDTSLTNLNEACGIPGLVVCLNPDSGTKQGDFVTVAGFATTTSDTLICDKKGKCTNSLKLQPGDSGVCPSGFPQFVTFTGQEFKAKSCFCPGGFEAGDGGQCCADSSRNGDGSCSTPYGTGGTVGTSTCMISLCTVNLSTYDPLTNFSLPYSCNPSTTCGGVTGTPCP